LAGVDGMAGKEGEKVNFKSLNYLFSQIILTLT
jgi:hypothetical protein